MLAGLSGQGDTEGGDDAPPIDLGAEDEEHTRSLLACVDFSHRNLDPDLRELLQCLSPFCAAVHLPNLNAYAQVLEAEPVLSDLAFNCFGELVACVHMLGQLQPHPQAAVAGSAAIQPTLPWFLARRLIMLNRQCRSQQKGMRCLGPTFLRLM